MRSIGASAGGVGLGAAAGEIAAGAGGSALLQAEVEAARRQGAAGRVW